MDATDHYAAGSERGVGWRPVSSSNGSRQGENTGSSIPPLEHDRMTGFLFHLDSAVCAEELESGSAAVRPLLGLGSEGRRVGWLVDLCIFSGGG